MPSAWKQTRGRRRWILYRVVLWLALGMPGVSWSQGTLNFNNRVPGFVDAPVFDADCTTKLVGSTFRAQLYVGPSSNPASLTAVGPSTPFLTGALTGYFNGGTRTVPGMAPGSSIFVQVRAWETACGATYEAAVAAGGTCRFGSSAVFLVMLGGAGAPPANLVGLQSFRLQQVGAPTLSAIPDQFTFQDKPTATIPFVVGDDSTPPGSLVVFGASSNTNVVPAGNLVFGGSGFDRTLTLFPGTGQVGTSTITVVVSDGARTSCDSFVLTVTNSPPLLAPIANQTAVINRLLSFPIAATDASAPPQKLTYSLTVAPPGAAINPSNGLFTWTPNAGQASATNVVTVRVTDDGSPNLSATRNFAIFVIFVPIDVYINEWMASNVSTYPDPEDGDFDDWIELYNQGPSAVNLSGFHLTDDLSNRTKFLFPPGSVIAPGGFLLVWADNETNQPGLHANFQLSTSGEAIGLFLNGVVTIDTVVFGPQTNDISRGRCPDGSTNIFFLDSPTPGRSNICAPFISRHPQSQSVNVGADATFGVTALGNKPLSYQWRRGNTNLAGQTNTFLTLTNAQLGSAGNYSVRVSNFLGMALSGSAALTVLAPPTITQQPLRQLANLNGFVTFSVTATGTPPPLVQWRKNGVNIPGATNFTLALFNVQRDDGATYEAVLVNAGGAVLSAPASLLINDVPRLPRADDFANRISITGLNGMLAGTNSFATKEPGEPNPAGRPGGRTVWYSWLAPATGIATFRTGGSTFDTVLGVYTGTVVSNLTVLASDEDVSGALTSEVRFNADAGARYQVAIDGAGGQSGDFILSWEEEVTADKLPVITQQPAGGTVRAGSEFVLRVEATAPGGALLSYQWYLFSNAIAGATAPIRAVSNIQPIRVGPYTVRVAGNGRLVESVPAVLEIGEVSAVQSLDKVEHLFLPPVVGSAGSAAGLRAATARVGLVDSFVPVTLGTTRSQFYDNLEAQTSPGEPAHCGVIGGASKWFGLRPQQDGLLVIDTLGSSFDTVVAVYTGPTNYTDDFWLRIKLVACDDNSAPDHLRSQLCFNAKANTNYMVAVDGANRSRGIIQLNWRLVTLPVLPPTNGLRLARVGSDVGLSSAGLSGVANPRYQWIFAGKNLSGATNDTLPLCNVQMEQAGDYYVLIKSGAATTPVPNPVLASRLAVGELKYELRPELPLARFIATGRASHPVRLERGAEVLNWEPIFPTLTPLIPLSVEGIPSSSPPQNFYRMKLLTP